MAGSRRRRQLKISLRWEAVVGLLAAAVFIGAFIYYFASNFIATEREYTVYSTMDEPTLPLIYVISDAGVINPMYGYLQDMGNAAAADLITPLPEDRHLRVEIEVYANVITGISYEIRSLDLSHFIERTEITDFEDSEDGIYLTLPIQNLLSRDTPYLLNIKLDIGEDTVNYYTRIIWTENEYIYEMIDTAQSFTVKSFDYNQARDLTVYLETDESADTSSLAKVDLTSGYSQITWGSTGMTLASTTVVNVKEYDGMMGAVEVRYLSERVNESGQTERYENSDEYTLRVGSERLYMMSFERETNEIFEGQKYLFAGKRIGLGIVNEDRLQTRISDSGQYLAFKSSGELWLYDQDEQEAVNVFTYRSATDRMRADYAMHDIKILSLSDEGMMDFVVYGYVNRGRHEGYNGIIYYRYDASDKNLREILFIPRAATYERIGAELDEMCVKIEGEMFYFKQEDSVVAIDLTSLEMLDVVSGLTYGDYAISFDQTVLAWVDGDAIRLMDLAASTTRFIYAESGEILSVVGFYGSDLIYGITDSDALWIIHNTVRGAPAKTLRIVDSDLQEQLCYEKTGLYFEDTLIEDNRIQITQYKRVSEHQYRFSGRDTVVYSGQRGASDTEGISWDQSETKKKVCFLDLDKSVRTSRSVDVTAPKSISVEGAGTVELTPKPATAGIRYLAYCHGHLKGTAASLRDAVDMIYDEMGYVTDEASAVVYARADKGASGYVSDPMSAALPMLMEIEDGFNLDTVTDSGCIVMNAADIPVNRLMYYVSRGCPVAAFMGEDYQLIYAYTGTSVSIYDPSSGTRTQMSLEDAAIYFDAYDNDFIVFRDYPGDA